MGQSMYKKILQAGDMVTAVLYSRSLPGDSKQTREMKQNITNKAQKYINIKNTTQKLELLLWANFDNPNTKWCTFTFDSANYPVNMPFARKLWRAYVKKLGKALKKQGAEWKYIYTVEGNHSPQAAQDSTETAQQWENEPWKVTEQWEKLGTHAAYEMEDSPCKIHFHCFLILRENDCALVRKLWQYGFVSIKSPSLWNPGTFSRLAHYMTKESRNCEKAAGVRAYTPSLGLTQPVEVGGWCSDTEHLELPPGATKIWSGSDRNEFWGTRMEYLSYRLPKGDKTSGNME